MSMKTFYVELIGVGDTYLIGVMIFLGLWYKTDQKEESKSISIYLCFLIADAMKSVV